MSKLWRIGNPGFWGYGIDLWCLESRGGGEAGCWALSGECWALGTEYWVLGTQCWVLGASHDRLEVYHMTEVCL